MKKLLLSAAYACLYFAMVAPVYAETINFTGTLVHIYIDNGSSTYSGDPPGTLFSGSITYGDSASEASNIDVVNPISADYLFTGSSYGGTLTNGSTTINTMGANSQVGIGNNDSMGDDAAFLNDLYGTGSTIPTDIADTWGADSTNSTYNFGLNLYSLDTSLYSGLEFQRIPPALNTTDFEIFYVEELDALGDTIYLATGTISSVTASSPSAETVMPGHYLAAGSPGDTWTYEKPDASRFTTTLSAITSGTNGGRLKLGNSTEWIVYDYVSNVFTIYETDEGGINPPLAFPASAQAGQMIISSGEEFLFLKAPSITVKAGTFYDVLVLVWLDSEFKSNAINAQLGLGSTIAAAVTDVDWYDSGMGLIKQMGVDAATGTIDGGFELLDTSVPVPANAALWPMNVGQTWVYSRTDGNGFSWNVELTILEQVEKATCNSEQFFHFSNTNYDNAEGVKDNYVRSTVDAVYFCDDVAGELASFRANVPVGTTWTIEDDEHKRIENKSIHVPYFGQDASGNDIFRETFVFKMRDVVENSPFWYEYFVPGVGLVQEVDEWTDNPPKNLKLVSISIPDSFPWELFLPAIQAGANKNQIKR